MEKVFYNKCIEVVVVRLFNTLGVEGMQVTEVEELDITPAEWQSASPQTPSSHSPQDELVRVAGRHFDFAGPFLVLSESVFKDGKRLQFLQVYPFTPTPPPLLLARRLASRLMLRSYLIPVVRHTTSRVRRIA